jgi:hypothetical protein
MRRDQLRTATTRAGVGYRVRSVSSARAPHASEPDMPRRHWHYRVPDIPLGARARVRPQVMSGPAIPAALKSLVLRVTLRPRR